MKTKLQFLLAMLAVIGLAMSTFAQDKSSDKAVPTAERAMLLSVTGSIEAIDYTNRQVTLKGPLGRVETFAVSKDVKRLNEAKIGDLVTLDYYVGFVAELRKPTPDEEKSPLTVLDEAERAP